MKLGELTIYEAIIIILIIGLLALGVDHFRLRQEVGFGKKMDAFTTWQGQATNAINNISTRLPPAPVPPIPPILPPKPEVKK